MIKNIMTGIMNIYLVILWCFLLPFIYLFDRVFGGWKNDKIFQLEFVKDNEKKKNNVTRLPSVLAEREILNGAF